MDKKTAQEGEVEQLISQYAGPVQTHSEHIKGYLNGQVSSRSRSKEGYTNYSNGNSKTQTSPRTFQKKNQMRVTNNSNERKKGASSNKKENKGIDHVKANRSIMNNNAKINPNNLLPMEQFQKKQLERVQYQNNSRGASPEYDVNKQWNSQNLRNQQMSQEPLNNTNSFDVKLMNQQSQDGTMDADQSRDMVYYGDLSVNQNGKVLNAEQTAFNKYGPSIPNLDLNKAVDKRKKKLAKSQAQGKKKKSVARTQQQVSKQDIRKSKSPANMQHVQMVRDQNINNQFSPQSQLQNKQTSTPQNENGNRVISIGAVMGNVNIINQNANGSDIDENSVENLAHHQTAVFNNNQDVGSNSKTNSQIGMPIPSNRVIQSGVDQDESNEYMETNIYLQEDQSKYAVGNAQKQLNARNRGLNQKQNVQSGNNGTTYNSAQNVQYNHNQSTVSMKSSKKNYSFKRDSTKNLIYSTQQAAQQQHVNGTQLDDSVVISDGQANYAPPGTVNNQDKIAQLSNSAQKMANLVDEVNFIMQPTSPDGFSNVRQSVPEGQTKSVFDHDKINAYPYDSPNLKNSQITHEESFYNQKKKNNSGVRNMKKNEQISSIRNAYDQPNGSQLVQKRNNPMNIQQGVNNYRVGNVKQSVATNNSSQQQMANMNKYSKERTGHSQGIAVSKQSTLPKIQNNTGVVNYENSDSRDFNSSSRTKYGFGQIIDEKNKTFSQFDFNKKKKKFSNVPLDMIKNPHVDSQKIKLEQSHINELNAKIQEENNQLNFIEPSLKPSVMDSYDVSREPRGDQAIYGGDTSRKRPKTKQLSSTAYDHKWKYNAYRLVPVNYQQKELRDSTLREKKTNQRRIASQVFYEQNRNNKTQDQNRQKSKKSDQYINNREYSNKMFNIQRNNTNERLNIETAEQIGIMQTNSREYDHQNPIRSVSPDHYNGKPMTSGRRKQQISTSLSKVKNQKNRIVSKMNQRAKKTPRSPVKDYDILTAQEKKLIDQKIGQLLSEEERSHEVYNRNNVITTAAEDSNLNYEQLQTRNEQILAQNTTQTPQDVEFNSQSENLDLLNQSLNESQEDQRHIFQNDMTEDSQQQLMHQMNSKTDSNWKNKREIDFLANNSAQTSQFNSKQEYIPANESSQMNHTYYSTNKSQKKKVLIQPIDQKMMDQTEKLKKVVSSKQQLNQTQNAYSNNENTLDQLKNKKQVDKNKIKKINNTYNVSNQTNLQKKIINKQIELLNKKELRDAQRHLAQSDVEKYNYRIQSQKSPRESFMNNQRRQDDIKQRSSSPYAENNLIELNKNLRDRQNMSQFSRISRLTDKQNVIGQKAKNQKSINRGNQSGTHSEMSSSRVEKGQEKKNENVQYNDIVNIKLPTQNKDKNKFDREEMLHPIRQSRESGTNQISNSRMKMRLEKSFDNRNEKDKDMMKNARKLNTSRGHKRDEKPKSIMRPIHESKLRNDGTPEKPQNDSEEYKLKMRIPMKSIKEINKRMYYDRKYPCVGDSQNQELVQFSDQRITINDVISINAPQSSRSKNNQDLLNKQFTPVIGQQLYSNKPLTTQNQLKSPLQNRLPNPYQQQSKTQTKHVKFIGTQPSSGPKAGYIASQYEKIGANNSKFITADSPIDRYYHQYVIKSENQVFRGPLYGQAYTQSTRLRHAKGCVHYKDKEEKKSKGGASLSPAGRAVTSLSPQRKLAAEQKLENTASIADVVQLASYNDDARSVLQSQFDSCNCHMTNANMLRQRLTRSPQINKARASGPDDNQSMKAGDAMSMHGAGGEDLQFDPHFRTFRSPCRRSCSTNHNPMFHCQRFGLKMKNCKAVRPFSAQKTKEEKKLEKQEQLEQIDWMQTMINETVRDNNGGGYETEGDNKNADLPDGEIRSFNESPLDMSKRDARDAKHREMKKIIRTMKQTDEDNIKHGILTDKEVHNYKDVIRNQSLKYSISEIEKKHLMTKCWKTLGFLMNSLILKNDFQLINASYKTKNESMLKKFASEDTPKSEQLKYEDDQLIKVLVRCEKMYDAKQEILRVLVKVKKREALMVQFDDEVAECTDLRAKGYYYIILKLSCRIHNQVERLRVDNPMLNRPFIYNKYNLQHELVREQLNIRENLGKKFRGIKKQLDRVLDKSGQITKLQHIEQMNKEMASEDDSASQGGGFFKKALSRKETIANKHKQRLDRGALLMNIKQQEQSERGSSRGGSQMGVDRGSQPSTIDNQGMHVDQRAGSQLSEQQLQGNLDYANYVPDQQNQDLDNSMTSQK